MTIESFLQMAEKFEIQVFEKSKIPKDLKKEHVCYVGVPQKHPHDVNKIILIQNPLSTNTTYYEFFFSDISYVEKLPSLINLDGETINVAQIWVKKMSIGIQCIPFIVADTKFSI